jgi:hypothetical protein
MKSVKLLFIFLIFYTPQNGNLHASSLRACYDVKVFFLKVGESCITYSYETKEIKITSFMKTVNIGSLAKRIYDHGGATVFVKDLKPIHFQFHQEEGSFKRFQEYLFKDNKIYVTERKYKKLSDEIEREEKKSYPHKGEFDPYSAALFLFLNVEKQNKGTIPIFYDDKFYEIPWEKIEKTTLTYDITQFNVFKIKIQPNIKGKGLLQPKGEWFLWIDEKTKLPIEMEVGFIIGSVKVKISQIEGNRNLLNVLSF